MPCPARALLVLMIMGALSAGDATQPLPWRFGDGTAALPAPPSSTPAPGSAPSVLTLSGLTQTVMGQIRPDGSADLVELEEMLKSINRQVSERLVLTKEKLDGNLAQAEEPLAGQGWKLWIFWSMDVPEIDGLASAIVKVRGSGLATVRPVHLSGMRHWERWVFRMNDYREALTRTAKACDQARCNEISAAWKAETLPFNEMLKTFYRSGVGLMSNVRSGVALRVETVPSFRLVSPTNRVHALDGFGPTFDLVAWVRRAQEWEAQYDQRQEAAR